MDPGDNISAEQVKELADELSALSKEHAKAVQSAAYISMSREEGKAYDLRRTRISRISSLLEKFKPKRKTIETDALEVNPFS